MSFELDDDDLPVGRILSRRETIALLAASGASLLLGCNNQNAAAAQAAIELPGDSGLGNLTACVVRPELTIGPYFVDEQLNRQDIRTEPTTGALSKGVPLDLAFHVTRIDNGQCEPLERAMVDIWQCDADGVYSGVNDRMIGFNTVGQKFLRGYQLTDKNGSAQFTTIYPGWYQGRTVHIHFMVRVRQDASPSNAAYEFTSQLFFDDALSDRVFAQAPYAAKGRRTTRNTNDGIFRQSGSQLLLNVAEASQGYRATFDIGLDLSDTQTGRSDRMGGRGRGRGRGGPPGGRS